jgi:hypothetical protein
MGEAKNTAQWQGADVYTAAVDTEGPDDVTTAWGAAWEAAGLLDGAEGFTEGRDEDTSESYAWGGILYRRTKSKHKRTFKFVALEDNKATFRLVNPGSERITVGGVRTSRIVVPTSCETAVAPSAASSSTPRFPRSARSRKARRTPRSTRSPSSSSPRRTAPSTPRSRPTRRPSSSPPLNRRGSVRAGRSLVSHPCPRTFPTRARRTPA